MGKDSTVTARRTVVVREQKPTTLRLEPRYRDKLVRLARRWQTTQVEVIRLLLDRAEL